jgi:hypothetical protein
MTEQSNIPNTGFGNTNIQHEDPDPQTPDPSSSEQSDIHTRQKSPGSASATTEPYRIEWASDVEWLRRVDNAEEVDIKKIDESDTLMWSAKVIYLLFNEIGPADIEIILSQLGIVDKHSIKYAMLSKQLWSKQSRW